MDDFISVFAVIILGFFALVYGVIRLSQGRDRSEKSGDSSNSRELYALLAQHEARIKNLEKKLNIQIQETEAPAPRTAKSKAASAPASAPSPSISSKGLEEAMAGKWFQWVALTALLFGLGYFLKLAFENDWISPLERVALGWILGGVFLGLGHRWFKKYPGWAHGLAGSGLAFLYLSTFAGFQYYSLLNSFTAFGLMVLTTALGSTLAILNRKAVLATFAVSGGFLTPLLVSTGTNQEAPLMGYLLILNAGVIAISIFGEWKFLRWCGFFATLLQCAGWSFEYYRSDFLWMTFGFYSGFYLLYAAASWIYDFQKNKNADSTDALFSILNAAVYFGASYSMLNDHALTESFDWLCAVLALALCVFYAWQSRALLKSPGKDAKYLSTIFFGLASAFLATAIPIYFKREWITVGWSIEAVFILWAGLKESRWATRQMAYAVMLLVGLRLVFFDWDGVSDIILFNQRLIPYGCALGSVVASIFLLGRYSSKAPEAKAAIPALAIAGNLIALLYLSLEVSDYWNRQTLTSGWSPKGLSLSVLWLFYATAMMLYGFWKNFRGLRLLSIMAFCVTIFKVFFFDLSELQGGYRVVSLVVLGLILLAVSFGYQRRGKK